MQPIIINQPKETKTITTTYTPDHKCYKTDESLYRITFNKHCEVIKLWFNIVKQDREGYDWHTPSNTTAKYYLFNYILINSNK